LIHRFDLLFEPPRGTDRAELAGGCVYKDSRRAALVHSGDTGDKGFRLAAADANRIRLTSDTRVADVDIVTTRGEISTGAIAQCNVIVAASFVYECTSTDGRVVAAT
jgi:hypothetical protein